MDTLRLMYQEYKEIGYRYAVACIVGIGIGYVIGSLWVDKSGDEMMRQMVTALMIARGM